MFHETKLPLSAYFFIHPSHDDVSDKIDERLADYFCVDDMLETVDDMLEQRFCIQNANHHTEFIGMQIDVSQCGNYENYNSDQDIDLVTKHCNEIETNDDWRPIDCYNLRELIRNIKDEKVDSYMSFNDIKKYTVTLLPTAKTLSWLSKNNGFKNTRYQFIKTESFDDQAQQTGVIGTLQDFLDISTGQKSIYDFIK